jgi:hypothetical protein
MDLRLRVGTVVVAFVVVLARPAFADTLHVPADFATIQSALDEAQMGDTVLVSSGTYPEGIALTGRHDLALKASGKVLVTVDDGTPALLLTDCQAIAVTGLRFSGGTGDGVRLDACDGITLSKCRIEHFDGHGVHGTLALHVTLDHCTIRDVGGTAIALPTDSEAQDCDDFVVTHCKILDLRDTGLFAHVYGDHGRLEHCTFTSGALLGDVVFGRTGNEDGEIVGNTFAQVEEVLVDSKSAMIHDNVFRRTFLAIESQGCTVSTNVFKESFGAIFVMALAHDTIIAGNRVSAIQSVGTPGASIYILDCASVQVVDNVIKGKPGDGLFALGCTGLLLEGNQVRKAIQRGLFVGESTGTVVVGNTLKSCADGVIFNQACSDGIVLDNLVTSSSGTGLDIAGDDMAFTLDVIKNSGMHGVRLRDTASGNVLHLVKATGSGEFDLLDESGGANDIQEDNEFGTSSP